MVPHRSFCRLRWVPDRPGPSRRGRLSQWIGLRICGPSRRRHMGRLLLRCATLFRFDKREEGLETRVPLCTLSCVDEKDVHLKALLRNGVGHTWAFQSNCKTSSSTDLFPSSTWSLSN